MATDIKIPVFDGEEYSSWKKRILMYLKMKKCHVVVTRAKTSLDKEDWDENDLKVINYIYSAITNKQMEFVSDKETAYEIMKKFDEMYLKELTALQIVCRNKLENLRLRDYSTTVEFFNDFEKLMNELKVAGAQVTEKEKLNYMLRTLPESLSYIGDLVDVLKEEDQTVEYVKSKIKMIDMKEKNDGGNLKTNTFMMERKSPSKKKQEQPCYNCGKTGHIKYHCPTAKSNRGSWKRTEQQRRSGRGNFNQHGSQRGGYSHWQRGSRT